MKPSTITSSQLASLGSATAHQITTHYRFNHLFPMTAIIRSLCHSNKDCVQTAFVLSFSCSLFSYLPHSEQLANGSALFLSAVLQKSDCVFMRRLSTWTEISHTRATYRRRAALLAGCVLILNGSVCQLRLWSHTRPSQSLPEHTDTLFKTSGWICVVVKLSHLPLKKRFNVCAVL